ncbi:helix-turn-helix domain-containing protein [Hathewaya massiliensis]|uniref:helix-turn-helix domain-containing protein n=1 Tax=Hathewaya massiliensis TaxID=1964382 RepID=UPI001158D7E4|nr:helix-turn-helix transcriptional regulator [Hathewaya massiliensis]
MSIGENIKTLRKANKMSIRDLVEISGVGKSTISDIENDKVSPTAATLQKIATALNVSVNDLFDDKKCNVKIPERYSNKKEIAQYNEFIKDAGEFFMDDSVAEEDKEKIFRDITELFWKSKEINKNKYTKKK